MSAETRPPLAPDELTAALVCQGSLWREVRVVDSTASTNADLAALVAAGAGEGFVEVAEHQQAGRGRLDRTWVTPPRAALTFSMSLVPPVPVQRWSWLPLLAGVAAVDALPVEATLKWPNDVLAGGRKLAGILAERVGDAVVLGIGLNVAQRADELPVDTATSLHLAGAADADRGQVLVTILRELADWYSRWSAADGDPVASGLADAYRARCGTLGQVVRVTLPDGGALVGEATGVSATGALVVDAEGARHELAAGDVVHVRGVGRSLHGEG